MMRALRSLVAGLLCAGLAVTAFAAPMTNDEYQAKLKTYDPAAIAAATSYAKSFDMVGGFAKNAPKMAQSQPRQADSRPCGGRVPEALRSPRGEVCQLRRFRLCCSHTKWYTGPWRRAQTFHDCGISPAGKPGLPEFENRHHARIPVYIL